MLEAPLYITVEQILNSDIGNEHTTLSSCSIDTRFFTTYADDIKSLDVLTSIDPEICKKTKEPANRLFIYITAIEAWLKTASQINEIISNTTIFNEILNLRANFENMSNTAGSYRTIGVPACDCKTVLKVIEDCLKTYWDKSRPAANISLTGKSIKQLTNNAQYSYLNNSTCIVKNDATLNIYNENIKNSIIQLSDIQCQLYKFISFLKRINKIQFILTINNTKTTVNSDYQCQEISGYNIPTGGGIQARIDTTRHHCETVTAFPVAIMQEDISENAKNLIIDALIDTNELHNLNSLYKDDATGSNGTYSMNTNVIQTKHTELDNIDFKQFGLMKKSIINKKQICSIIDKIFYSWYNHINIINYNINVCHCNCHINIVTFQILRGNASSVARRLCCHSNSGGSMRTESIINNNLYS